MVTVYMVMDCKLNISCRVLIIYPYLYWYFYPILEADTLVYYEREQTFN